MTAQVGVVKAPVFVRFDDRDVEVGVLTVPVWVDDAGRVHVEAVDVVAAFRASSV